MTESMKKILILSAAALLCSCHSSKLEISGRLVGHEQKMLYVEHSRPGQSSTTDSIRLDETGSYRLTLREAAADPELYLLRCGAEQVPLLLQAGDRVEVNSLGSITHNYTVEGSDESALLREFYSHYTNQLQQLDRLAALHARSSGKEQQRVMEEYAELFRQTKRDQLRFVVENKASLAAIYALYQRLPGDSYLFNSESDVIYYRTVAEAVAESYPESSYVKALQREIERMEQQQQLLSNVKEASFPDLELSDMYGKRVRLSSLEGQVILLDFWSAQLGNSNALNAELKKSYEKYHDRGFEIYQVAVDISKALWINTVQEQQLPWISVSDLQGENSIACRLYQVSKLPMNFLIDRSGEIVGQNLYGEALDRKIDSLL